MATQDGWKVPKVRIAKPTPLTYTIERVPITTGMKYVVVLWWKKQGYRGQKAYAQRITAISAAEATGAKPKHASSPT